MIVERLEAFFRTNKRYPDHTLFYRGVSEGEFGMINTEELPQIRNACTRMEKSKEGMKTRWTGCKITLVVVGKRHHARFYPKANGTMNLDPGTVIDKLVVAPKQFSFYLQSNDSPLGTASSAHYVVLKNESGYSGAVLEQVVSLNPTHPHNSSSMH